MTSFNSFQQEVRITVDELKEGKKTQKLVALFTMVARNPKTNQAAPITPLVTETAEEKFFFEQGERNLLILSLINITKRSRE